MGFFDKLKSFGSKIVRGIRKGWDFVKTKVAPVVRKVLPTVSKLAPVVATAVGRPDVGMAVSKGADTAGRVMDALHLG